MQKHEEDKYIIETNGGRSVRGATQNLKRDHFTDLYFTLNSAPRDYF